MTEKVLWAALVVYALLLVSIPLVAEAGTQHHTHASFTSSPEAAEDCHSGATARTTPPYGFVYVVACVLDDAERPVATLESPQWVRWHATGPASVYDAATETDDEGRVPATIRIQDVGTAQITASLCADLGCSQIVSENTLELRAVHQDPPPPHCNDGVDNDADGQTDFPNDPDCESAEGEESPRTSHPHWVLTIRYDPPRFLGRMFDEEPRCQAHRMVRVKRVRPGPDRLIGRDRTDRRGNWEVPHTNARGRFYATARRAERYDGKQAIACPANRSVTIIIR